MPDLRNIDYSPSLEYRSESEYNPYYFFLQALSESNEFNLLLGYFTSSSIKSLSLGFTKFLMNDGVLNMVINNVLTPDDKETIKKGLNNTQDNYKISLYNYSEIAKQLDSYGKHFFECIAYLISKEKINIRAIKPKRGAGISHYKSGYFSDGINKIIFKGSCNFTAFALLENLEELTVRTSWGNEQDVIAINDYLDYFHSTYNGKNENIEILNIDDVEARIVEEFGAKTLEELYDNEQVLFKKFKKYNEKKYRRLHSKIQIFKEDIFSFNQPKFPFSAGPRKYQVEAFNSWKDNGYNGIFAMATGTGKTITALNCLLEIYKESKIYQAIILVPSIALVEQWEIECKNFNFKNIIQISSKNEYKQKLKALYNSFRFGINDSFIIISTYQSFIKDSFLAFFDKLPKNTLFIADEAHNIGSKRILSILPQIKLQRKLALSATPKRIYDPEGTKVLEDFFSDSEPYIYSYSLEKAIDEDILTKYYYYPYVVELNEKELDDYIEISNKISKFYNSTNDSLQNNQVLTALLLKRKRIIHKAINKLKVFEKILIEHIAKFNSLDYVLVYAPEGFSNNELDNDINEDARVIDDYNKIIREVSPESFITSFTSKSENRDFILKEFSDRRINILTSMKCLDEGVDIPRTQTAIFCSSTGNPRQFIQRRGRILRKHPEKDFAYIYDMVVAPPADLTRINFRLERSLLRKELERVAYFAFLSLNFFDTKKTLEEITELYDLNLYEIQENLR